MPKNSTRNRHTGRVNAATQHVIDNGTEVLSADKVPYYAYTHKTIVGTKGTQLVRRRK